MSVKFMEEPKNYTHGPMILGHALANSQKLF